MQNTIASTALKQSPKTIDRTRAFKEIKLPLDLETQLAQEYNEDYGYTGDRHIVSETYIDTDAGYYSDDTGEYVLDRILRLSDRSNEEREMAEFF